MQTAVVPIFLLVVCAAALAVGLLVIGGLLSPGRPGRVKRMPYESGMDPVHDTRRRFDVRFHLLAIAFLVFDVELLFLYPWAVAVRAGAAPAVAATEVATAASDGRPAATPVRGSATRPVFWGGLVFIGLLTLGFVYDWRKGVFRWR